MSSDELETWDESDDEDDSTDNCPHCGRSIYDDSERCPNCGMYLSREYTPPARKPWYVILGAIVSLGIVAWWLLG
jgi:uncharacterized paraquat-inducible protein A